MKQLLKKFIVVLLLIGFTNMVTARPGCHFTTDALTVEAGKLKYNKTESFTIIEYMLERVHGLSDNIPNNEESGAHYSVFRVVNKAGLPRLVVAEAPMRQKALVPDPVRHTGSFNRFYPSPALGHFHGFLFRLTPF